MIIWMFFKSSWVLRDNNSYGNRWFNHNSRRRTILWFLKVGRETTGLISCVGSSRIKKSRFWIHNIKLSHFLLMRFRKYRKIRKGNTNNIMRQRGLWGIKVATIVLVIDLEGGTTSVVIRAIEGDATTSSDLTVSLYLQQLLAKIQ